MQDGRANFLSANPSANLGSFEGEGVFAFKAVFTFGGAAFLQPARASFQVN